MRIILQSKTHSTNSGTLKVIPPVAFDCKAIYLTSVSVPYTFYNIRQTNNSLKVNDIEYTIDPQNYNSIQLASALQTILNSIGNCTVSFNKQKLKYIVNNTGPPFTIDFQTSRKVFGFQSGEHTISTGLTQSQFIGDINDGIHSLILTSNVSTAYSCLFNETFGTQIIARIPIEAKKPGEMINFQDSNNQRPIARNIKALQYFEIQVLDDDLNYLELNGLDFQVELFIEIQEENEITDMIRGEDNITEEEPTNQMEEQIATSNLRTNNKQISKSLDYERIKKD